MTLSDIFSKTDIARCFITHNSTLETEYVRSLGTNPEDEETGNDDSIRETWKRRVRMYTTTNISLSPKIYIQLINSSNSDAVEKIFAEKTLKNITKEICFHSSKISTIFIFF